MRKMIILFSGLSLLLTASIVGPAPAFAQPSTVSYQGQLLKDGVLWTQIATPFKFAIVTNGGSTTIWSNDGSSTVGNEPTASVPVDVANGIFTVALGDPLLPMDPITADLLAGVTDAALRVWVNTGGGFELLTPDQFLASSAFALHSESAEKSFGSFVAGGLIESTTGGFKFPDGTTQTTAAVPGGGEWATSGLNIYNTNTGGVGVGTGPSVGFGFVVQDSLVSNINAVAMIKRTGTGSAAPLRFENTTGLYCIGITQNASFAISSLNNNLSMDDVVIVDQNSNVGIGQRFPTHNLHVKHSQYATDGGLILEQSSSGAEWQLYTSQSTNDLRLYYNGGARGSFDDVTGNYVPVSDRRLKKNIEPMDGVLQKLMALKPRKYQFKESANVDEKHFGLIAQEVADVFPELVSTTPDDGDGIKGLQTVSYTELIPVLIKTVQEQQEMIQELATRVRSLEGR